ncbi:hypothetical protein THAOC_05703, partial [Thalassiosira oceanica]
MSAPSRRATVSLAHEVRRCAPTGQDPLRDPRQAGRDAGPTPRHRCGMGSSARMWSDPPRRPGPRWLNCHRRSVVSSRLGGPEDGQPQSLPATATSSGNLSRRPGGPLDRLGVESVASFDSCTGPSHALMLPRDRPGRLGGAAVLLRSIGDDVHTAGAGRKARTGDA